MIVQAIDKNHPTQGFNLRFVEQISNKIDKLFVLALSVGKYNLPSDIQVLSLGKEQGANKIRKFINFHKVLLNLVFKRKINAIYVHQGGIYPILLYPYKKIAGIPVIQWKSHSYVSLKTKINLRCNDKVLTATKGSFPFNTPKKRVIGFGIPTQIFKPLNSKAHSKFRRNRIISVGRISPIKHLDILVEAANIIVNKRGISQYHFTVVGVPMNKKDAMYLQRIQELIGKYELEDYFETKGFIQNDKLPQLLNNSDLFVNLSDTGAPDKAVFEAMACESLIITSNKAFNNIIREYRDLLLMDSNDPHELAGKIIKILNLGQREIDRIKRSLREIIVSNYNLDNYTDKIVQEIRKLISPD